MSKKAAMKAKDREPDGLEPVISRLQQERSQLPALDLDRMKTRIMAGAKTRSTKGARMRGRIAISVLTLGLLGAGAGGVLAGSSGSSNGASSASAQYRHCPHGQHRDGHTGKCVPAHCPKGTHRDPKNGKCDQNNGPKPCHKGEHRDHKTGKCVKSGKSSKGHHGHNGHNGHHGHHGHHGHKGHRHNGSREPENDTGPQAAIYPGFTG